ncbi:holo-ACP synthase [bacterium]|nr:holo-ACP synthase [bacterium]
MEIKGCGIDVVEVERIKKIINKNGRFISKVFTPEEIAYCQGKKNKWEHFAVRFAAKEAVLKALENLKINFKNIGIKNEKSGKPQVVFGEEISPLKEGRILISLSHTHNCAVAQALWVVDK